MDESRKLDRTWLCSIVFSDIVNYSSQPVDLQIRWKGFFNDALSKALETIPVDDRVVLDTGDGAAICFLGDPETALISTLALRAAFVAGVPADFPSPSIRLGINLGPVKLVRDINANLNALGDGINVAQRIMSFAGTNQVLVSRSFFEVMSRMSDDYKRLFKYEGVRQDKHVREHAVYELAPAGSETRTAPFALAPDTEASSAAARRGPGMWIGGAAGIVLLVTIAALMLRPKPQPVPSPEPPRAESGSPAATPPPAVSSTSSSSSSAPSAAAPSVVKPTAPAPAEEKAARPLPTATATGTSTAPAKAAAKAAANSTTTLAGRWQADVKYSWGPTYTETFDFKEENGEVSGAASYVRTKRVITDGKLQGNKLTFVTKSQTMLGDKTYDEKHSYVGKLSGDTIDFTLQTDSGYDVRPAEEFTARRMPPDQPANPNNAVH